MVQGDGGNGPNKFLNPSCLKNPLEVYLDNGIELGAPGPADVELHVGEHLVDGLDHPIERARGRHVTCNHRLPPVRNNLYKHLFHLTS